MKQARSLPILALLLLLMPALVHAQSGGATIKAASCQQSDVNAVINGPTHKAVNGDTIQIPAGSCTWTSGITISGVGITITGTGTPNSGGGTFGAGVSTTSLVGTSTAPLFKFTNITVGQTARVTLMTLGTTITNNSMIPGPIAMVGICTTAGCPQGRIDNITYSSNEWASALDGGMIAVDNIFAVVDHNSASESPSSATFLVQISFDAWQGVGTDGDNSFASPDTFGTAQSVYIENNSVAGVRFSENDVSPGPSIGGGRWVCRFNVLTNMSGDGLCGAHGTAWSGRGRGMRQVEAYYNNVTIGSAGCDSINGILSGTGYYFSNSISAPGAGCNEFLAVDIPTFIKTAAPWGSCNGAGPYDQTPFSSTSACVDQPGSGAGTLLQGATPVLATVGSAGWPHPALDPVYEAGDRMTAGGLGNPVAITGDGTSTRVLFNRDVYAEVSQSAQSSPTSPFNGTTGTGYGTLANRPTTCTTGVGYWATDQGSWNQSGSGGKGVLYICGTSGWPSSPSYTPYTYPHPLTTGGTSTGVTPNPPTSLTAQPQP
jgi:hypothetical protein